MCYNSFVPDLISWKRIPEVLMSFHVLDEENLQSPYPKHRSSVSPESTKNLIFLLVSGTNKWREVRPSSLAASSEDLLRFPVRLIFEIDDNCKVVRILAFSRNLK